MRDDDPGPVSSSARTTASKLEYADEGTEAGVLRAALEAFAADPDATAAAMQSRMTRTRADSPLGDLLMHSCFSELLRDSLRLDAVPEVPEVPEVEPQRTPRDLVPAARDHVRGDRLPRPRRAGEQGGHPRPRPCLPPTGHPVDVPLLVERLGVAGGVVRNVVLTAAHSAAQQDVLVGMRHLVDAAERGYRKLRRLPPSGWLGT